MKKILGYVVKDGPDVEAPQCSSPVDAVRLFCGIANRDREHLQVAYLNARNQVIDIETVSVGTLSASLVHPREVYKGAILANAAAVIIAHNHPSGDVTPSPEDKDTTRRIRQAGETLGIPLTDHVILGGRTKAYTSFRESGIL